MKLVIGIVFIFVSIAYGRVDTKRFQRSAETCGVSKVSSGFIVRGESFSRGNFPWIVALTYTKVNPPIFFCGGTVISSIYVITAAHCIFDKHSVEALLPRDILALFGAHVLSNLFESGRYSLSPKKIILHEDWNPLTTQYDGDVALLKFEKDSIYFNDFVQPICLWNSKETPNVTEGIVPGWGKSEDPAKKHEDIPKLIKVLIQSNDECLPGETLLADLSSQRTFCAGSSNNSGICFGDSGGGLFIKVNGLFHLKGIVSSSLLKNAGTECDVSKKAVYTDVLKYTGWISNKTGLALISSANGEVSGYTEQALRGVSCTITFKSWAWHSHKQNLDTCDPVINEVEDENFTISTETDEGIQAFDVQHKLGVKFLPTNLVQVFPDLIAVQVLNCSVSSVGNHFEGLLKLQHLNLGRNKIEHVASDAFIDLLKLEFLELSYNRIKFLAENTFESQIFLEGLYLDNNKIQLLYPKIFGSLVKVEHINIQQNKIPALDEKIFENVTSLKELLFAANKLETIPKNLLKNNLKLQEIWFSVNNIRFIDANVFDHLPELKYLNLRYNLCIEKEYDENSFDALGNDLKQNCGQEMLLETTTSEGD